MDNVNCTRGAGRQGPMQDSEARAPRAATPPRRRAWLRIFVVRCGLPCDPPVGGHACNGGMIPRFHHTVEMIAGRTALFDNLDCWTADPQAWRPLRIFPGIWKAILFLAKLN